MNRVAASLRIAAPHRIILAVLLAIAWAAAPSAPPAPGVGLFSGVSGTAAFPAVVPFAGSAALAAAVCLVRAWFFARSASGPARVAIVVAAAVAAAGAVGLYAAAGAVLAALIAMFVVVVEAAFYLAPLELARRVPVELEMALNEGVLVPIAAFVAWTGGWHVPWALTAVTALAGTSFVVASSLPRPGRAGAKPLSSRVPPTAGAVLAIVLVAGAIVLVLAGRGPSLDPERALLASAVALMGAVFATFALADRRTEWRARRVEILVSGSVVSLYGGITLVLLLA